MMKPQKYMLIVLTLLAGLAPVMAQQKNRAFLPARKQ